MRADGRRDTDWFDADGSIVSNDSWNNPGIKTLCVRRLVDDDAGSPQALLLLLNASPGKERFVLPAPDSAWYVRLNSADLQVHDQLVTADFMDLAAHSAAILSSAPKDVKPS
jgi:pullulanase/glycogen debranching enzyme